jgi:hypothetical protein
MSNILPFMTETLVAALLAVTIGYCWLLNRRLRLLSDDHGALRTTIGDLAGATQHAERAILGLREAMKQCDGELAERLGRAERLSIDLAAQLHAGEELMRRVAAVAEIGRTAAPKAEAAPALPARAPSSTLLAARAFQERALSRSVEMRAG